MISSLPEEKKSSEHTENLSESSLLSLDELELDEKTSFISSYEQSSSGSSSESHSPLSQSLTVSILFIMLCLNPYYKTLPPSFLDFVLICSCVMVIMKLSGQSGCKNTIGLMFISPIRSPKLPIVKLIGLLKSLTQMFVIHSSKIGLKPSLTELMCTSGKASGFRGFFYSLIITPETYPYPNSSATFST